jgi:hypothetical protein
MELTALPEECLALAPNPEIGLYGVYDWKPEHHSPL